MRRGARQRDLQAARGTVRRPLDQRGPAAGDARHVVQGDGDVRRDGIEGRVGQHRRRAAAVFLGRLEQQDRAPLAGTLPTERQRNAGQRRHMAVMTAEMRRSGPRRAPGTVRHLFDRQGVQFGTHHQRGARLTTVVDGGDTVASEPRDQPVGPGLAEEGGHPPRGLGFLAGDLRRPVQRVAQIAQHAEIGGGQAPLGGVRHHPFLSCCGRCRAASPGRCPPRRNRHRPPAIWPVM